MSSSPIEADYLVVGAGAVAMAFVDTLLAETDASVVMVDRHHRPGGHWNDAYPFVRLHQPSAFYGVNSRELGSGSKDATGLNQGLYEQASGSEVLAYFDQVMQQRFLPGGRVRYFPMCEYAAGPDGTHGFTSLVSGASRQIHVRRKLVDATHARTEVPSTHPPKYSVAPGVRCMPLNELPAVRQPHAGYVVVGSGKTGIDACLWLLQNGADPAAIRWIMPRDAWFLDRAGVQPGKDFFAQSIGNLAAQLEAVAAAASVEDLFARLEAQGQVLRLSPSIEPTVYRCATVTQAELQTLRRIGNVVRLGRVKAIEPTRIVLEGGSIPSDPGCVYIDCSANGVQGPPAALPVFDGRTINLLMVRVCQPAFSAALIGCVESRVADEAEKNALCAVVPTPARPADWVRMLAVSMANGQRWGKHPGLAQWMAQSRLNSVAALVHGVNESDTVQQALVQRYRTGARQAAANLPRLLAAIG